MTMLEAILDNPIAIREWRVLRRRAGDWRIWVGLRWPMDPIVWGAPVIITYALAPHALWVVLWLLWRAGLIPAGGLAVEPFAMLEVVLGCYVVLISLVLGATTVSREREKQTWAQIQVTSLTRRERAAGFLWGRIGPVWATFTLTAAFWDLTWPAHSDWMSKEAPPALSRDVLAPGAGVALCLAFLAGEMGLLASARSRRTATAVVLAVLSFSLTAVLFAAIAVLLALMVSEGLAAAAAVTGQNLYSATASMTTALAVLWIVACFGMFVALCHRLWIALTAAERAP